MDNVVLTTGEKLFLLPPFRSLEESKHGGRAAHELTSDTKTLIKSHEAPLEEHGS